LYYDSSVSDILLPSVFSNYVLRIRKIRATWKAKNENLMKLVEHIFLKFLTISLTVLSTIAGISDTVPHGYIQYFNVSRVIH
jgi:hypothetical protein